MVFQNKELCFLLLSKGVLLIAYFLYNRGLFFGDNVFLVGLYHYFGFLISAGIIIKKRSFILVRI